MNTCIKTLTLFLFLIISLTVSGCLIPEQPTAEVTLSGGVWYTRIDNQVIFEGMQLGNAITEAIEKLGPGVINIRHSGDLGERLYPKAGQTLDFHHNTIGGSQGIHVYHQNNVTIRNLHMNGNPLHSLVFNGSSNIHLHNIWLQFTGNSGGIRIDDDRYAEKVFTSDVKVTGKMLIEGTRGHGFETYGIDGIEIDEIVTKNTAGCGVLLNESQNVYIALVDAYRADPTGGYAGFRVANFNGPNVVVDKVIARECGRGFFSVSGSHGTTINYVDIDGTYNQAIFIQSSKDTVINGGIVTGYKKYGVVLRDGAHAGGSTENTIIRNLRVYDKNNNSQAVGIEEQRGALNNQILNNDLRNAGGNRERDLILRSGSGSIAEGNILTGDLVN